jgi:6-phosphogluconolactonase
MHQSNRQIQVLADPEAVSRVAATEFLRSARASIQRSGRFAVALSGGSTPKQLYELLASAEFRDRVPWANIHFFWGDERHVPPTHPNSNYRMAYEAMLSKVPVPAANIHRVPAEDPDAKRAAQAYEDELRRSFQLKSDQLPGFDLVLLGMGGDGHTASLFPGTSALVEAARLVVAVWVQKLNEFRITLTLPVLNAAALVLFLVVGQEKAEVLHKVLEPAEGSDPIPAQLIQPTEGEAKWLVDQRAASRLTINSPASSGDAWIRLR